MTANAVVTPHRLSAEAARRVVEIGGNAVDGAVAAVAAQGVVAPETCGIGGDLFALVQLPGEDRPRALNASGRAGSNADPETLRDGGHEEVPPDHALTVTVPGCVDGLAALSASLGGLSLADALAPAIELAEEGFEASAEQARAFAARAGAYRGHPAVAEYYPGGEPVRPGDRVTRPALAGTLRAIATEGRDAFYGGPPAEDIVEAVGGLITMEDLDREHREWVDPIGVEIGGLTAWTTPPNSQGYLGPGALAVFQMLDPGDDPGSVRWWHLLIEAYRSLAWERDDLVSDPGHLALRAGLLLDRERLERAAATVSEDRAGAWPAAPGRTSGTAYICVADSDGMGVSVIQSNYRGTGSPFGAERSGFLLQDRGGGFSLVPGHPNELGPGKRPLHTLAPTLWTEGDQARWLLGTRGGAVQPQLVAQVGAAAIFAGRAPDVAQSAPRWALAGFGPGSASQIRVEPGLAAPLLDGLREKGHAVTELEAAQPGWGPLGLIGMDDDARRAAADPRVDTTSALVF
ncbi:MAG: gamma-glutamyltransferase [Actinobacteria bacterium]|nr:gamma-glutamyltransferase [Actinomycetota bacterium]